MELFKECVEQLFNRWSALKITVEHGMGGPMGHMTAMEIMNYIYEYCTSNENLTVQELRETLEEIMDEEFETICEDNSTLEMATMLIKCLQLCQSQRFDEVQMEMSELAPCTMWLNPTFKVQYVESPPSDSSDDEGDERMDEGGDSSGQTTGMNGHSSMAPPANATVVEEEPGWTTVRSKRK